MKLDKKTRAKTQEPVDGFDGGAYEFEGRQYVVMSTHGWAVRNKDGTVFVPVVYQPREPEEGEPHAYAVDRDWFLANFTKVEE